LDVTGEEERRGRGAKKENRKWKEKKSGSRSKHAPFLYEKFHHCA